MKCGYHQSEQQWSVIHSIYYVAVVVTTIGTAYNYLNHIRIMRTLLTLGSYATIVQIPPNGGSSETPG